jgi:hypothetical protein
LELSNADIWNICSVQYAKSSLRADVFRFAPNIGRSSVASFMDDFDYRAGSQSPRGGKGAATAAFASFRAVGQKVHWGRRKLARAR